MSDQASSYRLGLVLVTASAVALSMGGLFTRLISADTPTMLMWRGFFGAAGIFLFVAWRSGGAGFKGLGWPGLAYALISALGMICFISSLAYTSVAHNSIIYASVPFIAGAMGWLLTGDIMSRGAIAASLAALVGVAVMVGLGQSEGTLFGDFLSLIMTICVAGMMVIARRYRNIPLLAAAGLSALLTGLVMVPFAHLTLPQPLMFVELAGFGLVNSALGLALFTLGSKLLPPAETALIGALDAPLGPFWVWLFFAETPGLPTFIGGGIVFAAVIVHILLSLKANRSAQPA